MNKERLSKVKFSDRSKNFRKKISVLLLIVIIFGYFFLIGYMTFIAYSATGIRIEVDEFDQEVNEDEQEVDFGGTITIKNDHWYSVDITNFVFELKIYTDDDTDNVKIYSYDKKISKIPRLKNTEIELNFGFDADDIIDEDISLEDYEAMTETESLIYKVEISFNYALYGIYVEAEIEEDVDYEEVSE